MDIAPGLWGWLDQAHRETIAFSIDAAPKELLLGNDDLAQWANTVATFFRDIVHGTTRHFGVHTVTDAPSLVAHLGN